MDILRKGLLLRRSKKQPLIVAKIDARGNVDRTLDAELRKLLGELGYPGMAKALKRHKNGFLVYGGITFALIKKQSRLPLLIEKHEIRVTDAELATVLGEPKRTRRTSRRK